jgi:hypothetical protein
MMPPFLIAFFTISVSSLTLIPHLSEILLPAMATSHPHLFEPSVADASKIQKLIVNHFVLDRFVLQ